MHRLITASCVLALGLSLPIRAADEKDNPAVKKLNRDIQRHQDFLKRIEQSKGAGDVIFLGDSITHGWEGQKAWQEYFGSFKPVNLGIGGDQTGHVLWRITEGQTRLLGMGSPPAADLERAHAQLGASRRDPTPSELKTLLPSRPLR